MSVTEQLRKPGVYERSRETLRARRDAAFWSMTDRSGECWVWTGSRQMRTRGGHGGYGFVERHGRRIYAHRYAYQLAVGPIPDGFVVRHSCDNPPCINPAHLSVGTQADNVADMIAHGHKGGAPGERNSHARVTESQVREIRTLYATGRWTHARLGAAFGLGGSTIGSIVLRQTWRDVA